MSNSSSKEKNIKTRRGGWSFVKVLECKMKKVFNNCAKYNKGNQLKKTANEMKKAQ